jgi:DNA-binding NtrC family response regulator
VNTRKPQRPAPRRSPKGVPIAGNMVRKAVVFSQDESIIGLIRDGLTNGWHIESYSEPDEARIFLQRADIGVVVIDDVAIDQQTCGWLLVQVHRWAPDALIAYIASAHTPEVERRVRSRGVQYYLSRPVDRERTLRVLHSFAVAHL